ncbi:MAG: OmpH family outer membrane protein [Alphaproteobacteria bacterium]
MRLFVLVTLTLVFLLADLPLATRGEAQGVPSPIIAVVEYEALINESEASKSVAQQLVAIRDKYQAELDKEEGELSVLNEELNRQKTILSPEAFAEKAHDFERRVREIQAKERRINGLIKRAEMRALNEVKQVVYGIISDLARERGYTLVVPSSTLIYASDQLVISEEVLRRLNERLPHVQVVLEKN